MDYGEGEGAPPEQGSGPAIAAAAGPGRVSKWQRPLCSAQDGAPLIHIRVLVLLFAASPGPGELRPAAGGLRGRRVLPGGGGAGGRRGRGRPSAGRGARGRGASGGRAGGGGRGRRGQSRGELGASSVRGSCQEPGDPAGERAASCGGSLPLPSSSAKH